MSRRHFGTDGVRGVANLGLTPELAFALGQAAGRWLSVRKRPLSAVIGRDTRRSGPMLGAAFSAGLNSVGVDVDALGVAPTPAVCYAARVFDYGLGVVVSASHNPAPDNGIKLISHEGKKLADAEEQEIEALLDEPLGARPTGADVGSLRSDRTDIEAYLGFLEALVPERLDGLRVAVDAAHGAAHELAPEILVRLGADVALIGAEPDGLNINASCGATHPATLQEFTVATESHVGVAFDGDADRAIFSDEVGRLINGDRAMATWAAHELNEGRLDPTVVVGTVMSNGGFEEYLSGLGIRLERAAVGDKYVSDRISETGARVGGEQSGHIIFPGNGPTGDGLATMLEFLRIVHTSGRPSSEFSQAYESWPQLLVNIQVERMAGWDRHPAVAEALRSAETALAGRGRLNVRASGTQPILRVMVECREADFRDEVADGVVEAVLGALGGRVYSRVDLTHALGD